MTTAAEAEKGIAQHREQIDKLDQEILALLNERAGHSLTIRGLKPFVGEQTYDPAREERIFERLENMTEGPLRGEDIRDIWGVILRVMKEVQA